MYPTRLALYDLIVATCWVGGACEPILNRLLGSRTNLVCVHDRVAQVSVRLYVSSVLALT